MIRAIIFDSFGVIYDSPWKLFLESLGSDEERGEACRLMHMYDLAAIPKAELVAELASLCAATQGHIESVLFGGFVVNPEVEVYIGQLRKKYKTGLLTNIGESNFNKLRSSLEPLFDQIVASYSAGVAKPDLRAYGLIANRLGVEVSECVFIDDQQKQCEGALASGMQAILFENLAKLQEEVALLLDADR